jgi:Dolichyl-phosphate-mannose-protein mannosyltransferase
MRRSMKPNADGSKNAPALSEKRNARREKKDLRTPHAPIGAPSALLEAAAGFLILAAILAVVIARIRLLGVPLERDEGEYAYMGQLMLQGIAPYGVAANMKLPGTSGAYALIMAILGQTAVGIHAGLLLVNAASIVLVYLIGKRLFDPDLPLRRISPAALAAAGAYAVLSVGMGVLGVWAHATHFVVLPALGATLLLMRWSVSRHRVTLLVSGLLCGVAFIMKQPGLLFTFFGLFWVAWSHRTGQKAESKPGGGLLSAILPPAGRDLALFSGAVALPFGVTCLLLWYAGVFERFWFWVVTYGRYYGSMATLSQGVQAFGLFFPKIVGNAWGIWLLAAVGTALQFAEKRASKAFLLVFLAVSFAAVCPGLYFREHYFVLVLPAIALLAGAAVSRPAKDSKLAATRIGRLLAGNAGLWLIVAALAVAVGGQRLFLFESSPIDVSRAAYIGNPFVEAVEVASYVKAHSSPNSTLAVLGSEPEIYFYASRRSATPYIYVYPLMEMHPLAAQMQEEFISDVERSAPEYVVMVNVAYSWLAQPGSSKRVFVWWTHYQTEHYEPVGLGDMLPGGTTYSWDDAARQTVPKSHSFVAVFKRKHLGIQSN